MGAGGCTQRRAALLVVAGERAFSAARSLSLPLRSEHASFTVDTYLQARPHAQRKRLVPPFASETCARGRLGHVAGDAS